MSGETGRLIDEITERVLQRLAAESPGFGGGLGATSPAHPHESELRLLLDHGACRLACTWSRES